ncbi:2-oxoisovalerate dehydrogenase E1 component [Anseongella ginsenosidimutans]|uniref:2-oxoisovalerate dehydrogenase E1 component n=1 Tax=Anseongella ginsenosidimutans TaxID=496056 RepID=A0A4R3KXK8_9SPHI|nr:dehydrogenase E1 component subunit alpha/beta [Anseongella ginsenosidimutans]QEC51133.1 dehydrogenase [Anseongella ginsenosidimutans]TCS90198.1 2-oxoisovalerate dehydrogenase E1 component [Anseongella ginsenosidimutans]
MNRQEYMDTAFFRKVCQLLLRPRLIEEKMLVLLRQGRLGKWFSGIGQEAIAVGAAMAMQENEYILPMHRNLGVFTTRGVPLKRLMSQFQGKMNGFTQGRDRSFHFGSREHRLVGMISHLGPQLAIACGIALADKLSGKGQATLAFTGEGATSEGDFHEALNLASVWDLPVIFLIENNGYGLSTPVSEQYRCQSLAGRAAAYGMEGIQIDGNDVLSVFDTVKKAREYCIREQRPYLIECLTFRMRGHEEASGTGYVPASLLEEWAARDPIAAFERFLREERIMSPQELDSLKSSLREEINADVKASLEEEPGITASAETELADMYAPAAPRDVLSGTDKISKKRFIDALSDSLRLAMQRNPDLILIGQDIAAYGGVFKVTEGFLEEFGRERVRNTPLCESAVIGAAYGLSIAGYRSVVEMQFADFISMGFNQVVNNLAKSHYRWKQPASLVIRMPTGAGTGAGPFHSQSTEAWFIKTPGLKVLYPAFPSDAKGLLLAAVEDPNPVLFFEHKYLYRQLSDEVPEGYYTTPIGKARLVREGRDVSIITYGLGVHWALEVLGRHPEIAADLLDLRSLLPWDKEAVSATVKKTGKVLVLHEDTLTGGFGGEISAWIAEHCFRDLDAPVIRCCSLDTAVPMNPLLEANFLAKSRLEDRLLQLLAY